MLHMGEKIKYFLLILLGLVVDCRAATEAGTPITVRPDSSEQKVVLRFEQPLVSRTIVENSWERGRVDADIELLEEDESETDPEAHEEEESEDEDSVQEMDLGQNLFTISGDEQHKPTARWIDQDRLEIRFAKGTSCRTAFTFQLKPGTKYLGGELAPTSSISFRCPPDTLSGEPLMDDRGLGIMVCANRQLTHESTQLSPRLAPRFVFREAHENLLTGETYYTRTVEATLEPALMKQGINGCSLSVLEALGQEVWQKLSEDSVLPGHVVVRPQKELDPEKEWHLLVLPEEHSGFEGKYPVCYSATPQVELGTGLSWVPDVEKGYRLQVRFSQAMPLVDMPGLFERMQFEVAGQKAEAAGTGRKKVRFNNREIEFRYAGVVEPPVVEHPSYRYRGGDKALTYTPQGQAIGMMIDVSATAPETLEVALPEGTASFLGFKTRSEHRHRIALNPIWPELLPGKSTILPLKGDGKLRVPYSNLSELRVDTWRLAHEKTATAFEHELSEATDVSRARLHHDILRSREWRGMSVLPEELDNAERAMTSSRNREKERAERSRVVLEGARTFPSCSLPIAEDGLVKSGELVLDWKAALGGQVEPGMYLLRMQQVANAQVRAALRRMGRAEESLDATQDVLVQVTDLNVTLGQDALLVNHYSDGTPVERGTVSYLDRKDQVHELPIEKGIAWLPDSLLNAPKAWVRSGDDVVMVQLPYRSSRSRGRYGRTNGDNRTMLVLDRPLYRPGDTVHVRGVLRRSLPDGGCALPEEKVARLTLYHPDGNVLETRELSLGEYGAFETQYTLPEGEEDVTGNYALQVEAGAFRMRSHVNCQVFRRDAFKVKADVEVDPVAPQEFKLRVEAVDYSGTPLAGAACELYFDEGFPEKVRLDAAGKLEITRPVTKLMRERGTIHVSGSVSNDREEFVRITPFGKDIYPGDFHISLQDDRVRLIDSRTGKVLEREQRVQWRIMDNEVKPDPGANGLGFKKSLKTERACGTLVIPANCELGVPLPDAEPWRGKADYWELSGTDQAGREVRAERYLWFFRRSDSVPDMKCRHQEGQAELKVELPHAGTAHVFVGLARRLRHLTLPVQQGLQTLNVPLQPEEEGSLRFTLVLPAQKAGDEPVQTSGELFIPIRRNSLELQLQVPEEDCRPAQEVRITGRVLAGGKPADAEVTLFAVDEGMLSVAPYDYPYPEEFFCRQEARQFILQNKKWFWSRQRSLSPQMLPSFWRGDLMGLGYSLTPHPTLYSYRGGMKTFFSSGPLRRASRMMNNAYDEVFGMGSQMQYAPEACAPAPCAIVSGMTAGSGSLKKKAAAQSAYGAALEEECETDACAGEEGGAEDEGGAALAPHLRTNFIPVALWKGALRTDAEGRFSAEVKLPDTLTTYQVIAMAIDRSGTRFGSTMDDFTVNQPVMLTPGTPLFMSLEDTLRLPLSIVNNTDEAGTWRVSLEGAAAPQEITLQARQSGTLYFEFKATAEGTQQLRWTAVGSGGADAVQGEFPVRFPAPVLKELHRLTLSPGEPAISLASLLGAEVGRSTRGELELVASANPLLHLAGSADFLLQYPYGCTEQRASALIPWLLYEHLSPFCPHMAQTRPEEVKKVVQEVIGELLPRQCSDGGLAFWGGWHQSSLWATAHAGYVLKLAQEQGYEVPQEAMDKLYRYLWWTSAEKESYRTRFAIARTRGKPGQMKDILREALKQDENKDFLYRETKASMQFLLSMLENPEGADAAFRTWLRSTGRDYRHGTTQGHAWNLLALVEYLKLKKEQGNEASLILPDASPVPLDKTGRTIALPWQPGQEMRSLPTTLAAAKGTVYAALRVRALPPTRDYPGVTECGLQVTRLYETKGADGIWRPATRFKVGEVVRVTLTCAKVADELKYLVLEDYMPSCMEAINPNVPGQAAGLEPLGWSYCFDHREYLADRVRGFCTRWESRDLLNMRYYARVKRAGVSTAPPAQAQLMYEPQVYGLSPNATIVSEP